MPQVAQGPDPLAHMPTVNVSYIDIPKTLSDDPPLLQSLTETIKFVADKSVAAVVATAKGVGSGVMGAINNATSMARDVMDPHHRAPSMSHGDSNEPSRGRGRNAADDNQLSTGKDTQVAIGPVERSVQLTSAVHVGNEHQMRLSPGATPPGNSALVQERSLGLSRTI